MSKRVKHLADVAVLVAWVERDSKHLEVHYNDPHNHRYLLSRQSYIPKSGELVVLRCTGERPMWWKDAEQLESTMFTKSGYKRDLYLWEVVRDG